VYSLPFGFYLLLTIGSKSDHDDLKREMESLKPSSAVSPPGIFFGNMLMLTTFSRALTPESFLKTLLHLCS
jgi:hypothetical protein